jgi:UDP-N-acetyl-D-mannosaminuronate dehydrogenase
LNDFFSRIAIIGLGYARLPLSLQCARDSAA